MGDSRSADIGVLGSTIVASLAGAGNVVVTNPVRERSRGGWRGRAASRCCKHGRKGDASVEVFLMPNAQNASPLRVHMVVKQICTLENL